MTEAQAIADQTLPFSDFPTENLDYLGRSIPCLVLEDNRDLELEDGGFADGRAITVRVERGNFSAAFPPPVEGFLGISFRGKSYRVGNVLCEDRASSFKIDLVSEVK